MDAFRLILALHAPVILPEFVPRLDTLLHEATCRLRQDWTTEHELPLTFDQELGLYRCSQLIMATTPETSIWPVRYSRPTDGRGLERATVTNPPKRLMTNGGAFIEKLTQYDAYWPPYVVFDAEGDAARCTALLDLLDGMGREHNGGMGRFEVVSVRPTEQSAWQRRALPLSCKPAWAQRHHMLRGFERLTVFAEQTDVIRPPRIIREVLTHG